MVHIDGAKGESGGQILRSALTLSLLSKRPIHMTNVRANRPTPGLAPQHLTGLLAAAQLGDARVEGGQLESQDVIFEPGPLLRTGNFSFDVSAQSKGGSAGSVSLILQTILLPLICGSGPSQVILHGGTHVLASPPFEYLEGVFLQTLRSLGVDVAASLKVHGFYPAGGGEIAVDIKPLARTGGVTGRLRSLRVYESGSIMSVNGRAIVANLPSHIAQRMATRATKLLERENIQAKIQPIRVRSSGPGAGLFLVSQDENGLAGFSVLGEKGKPSEHVAEEAVDQFLGHHETGQPVDPYLADQLMLPLLLAEGQSCYRTSLISRHQHSHAELINLFYPGAVIIRDLENDSGEITVTPIDSMPRA